MSELNNKSPELEEGIEPFNPTRYIAEFIEETLEDRENDLKPNFQPNTVSGEVVIQQGHDAVVARLGNRVPSRVKVQSISVEDKFEINVGIATVSLYDIKRGLSAYTEPDAFQKQIRKLDPIRKIRERDINQHLPNNYQVQHCYSSDFRTVFFGKHGVTVFNGQLDIPQIRGGLISGNNTINMLEAPPLATALLEKIIGEFASEGITHGIIILDVPSSYDGFKHEVFIKDNSWAIRPFTSTMFRLAKEYNEDYPDGLKITTVFVASDIGDALVVI